MVPKVKKSSTKKEEEEKNLDKLNYASQALLDIYICVQQ